MKRFWVFSGWNSHPNGGWHDFHDSYDTAEEAVAKAKAMNAEQYHWAHAIDSVEGNMVWPTS